MCHSILRETSEPKSLSWTEWKEKQRKRQQTTVLQIDQCIVFQNSSSAGSGNSLIESKTIALLLFSSVMFAGENISADQVEFSAWAVSHHPTANPPFISPNQHRGGTIPVQLDTETPKDSDSLMLEDWQTSTDQSSI